MDRFSQTHKYKLIYAFSMPYETHKGLLKVGEATLNTNIMPNNLVPNCHELNQAAKKRIDSYTKTASMNYKLEYTELAIKQDYGYSFPFSDKDVHSVLMNSGVHKVQPNGKTGEEWFETDVATVKAAIVSVKQGNYSISSEMLIKEMPYERIDFREEQKVAVEKTIKTFEKDNEMLWYAKMRFGKTLTALEVIRRCQYRRVIIVTHRPVVDDGWSEDFRKIFFPGNSKNKYHYERKTKDSSYTFDEKTDYENDLKIRKLDADGDYFIYFASIQDLRGSQIVGGNFNKNNAVFDIDWDLIVIDEAHEGTQTELGDNVIKNLRKESSKVLALSGTPFNLLNQYNEENVYTWDYVMEQKKKAEWDDTHHGDHNPYSDLPKMHIYTYDLGEKLKKYISDEYETKAFNFREFFRVWYKGPNNNRELPKNAVEGKFVHENDVNAFLDMMVKEDNESGYPYSTKEYRDMFRHTLWMVPGVKEAKALSELLRKHPVFEKFGIANVAGEGDKFEEEHSKDALDLVRDTIKNHEYSITLSCGKLTTGVTVKEWTAVLMLSGSYSTAVAQYMQTIFRVQSADPIYHLFIDIGKSISDKGTFIHPARFLFNAGKTPKEWNQKILNDAHFKVVDYFANSTEVFNTVDIKGGVAITMWDNSEDFGKIGVFTAFSELRSITKKVINNNFISFADLVYPRDLYHLNEKLYDENPWAITRQSKGHKYDVGTNVFEILPELFTETKPTDGDDYALIIGRTKAGRTQRYVKRKYLKLPDNFDYYKVLIPKANGSGAIGEVLSTPVVGQPVVGHTVTFLSIGKFETELEATAVLKYIKTKFARTMLGTLKVTQDNPREVWLNVPMQDFTENSDIDWSKSVSEIDKQLYKKYNLSDEEIEFIETKVKSMEED